MKIHPDVHRASEQRFVRGTDALLRQVLARPGRNEAVNRLVQAVPTSDEAVLNKRYAALGLLGSRPSKVEYERVLGTNDLVDEFFLERALVAARPVCKLTTRGPSGHATGYATGFMVSPSLLLTNWHVVQTAESAENGLAEFDYRLSISGDPLPASRFLLEPGRFYFSDQGLDFALVAVSPGSQNSPANLSHFGFHKLIPDPNKVIQPEWISIIQHPNGEPRQFAIRENELLDRDGQFLWYRSDTAKGSSGAPAFNDSFQVVALHHGGKAREKNGAYLLRDGRTVTSLDGIDESDVVWEANEGVRVSALCTFFAEKLPQAHPLVQELFSAMKGSDDVMSQALRGSAPNVLAVSPEASPALPAPAPAVAASGAALSVPLTLNVSLSYGAPPPAAGPVNRVRPAGVNPSATVAEGLGAEKLVTIPVDPNYESRKGYDENHLGIAVPVPTPTRPETLSKLEDGSPLIPYEHFSVVLNKQRRLALYCASNLDYRARSRRPEPGDYTRKGLTGLDQNEQEGWVTDPRVPAQHQLPDRFYTLDGGAFDKGHIVRREDVCWGGSRAQVVRANCDTFHTTNCSPQVANFNRSNLDGLWGMLEDYVKDQAGSDLLTLFAGPVLAPTDRTFEGKDTRGPVRVQIPNQFWKVVVARDDKGLQAFGFLLDQPLGKVPLQDEAFVVDAEWAPHLIALAELEKKLDLTFPEALKRADQHGTEGGKALLEAAKGLRHHRP